MAGKTYVVIGSNCFTGSHIVDALLQNEPDCQVVGISRSKEYREIYLPYKRNANRRNFRFHQLDVLYDFDSVLRLLDEQRPQVVINVAALSEVALSFNYPVDYLETNTVTVMKLCEYLRSVSYLDRYIHISSAEVYGTCPTPLKEEARFNPSTPYAVSKAAADMYLNNLILKFKFPAIIIRSTNVYGKHQQLWKIIPHTAIYLKMGKVIELHGEGQAKKSFIHVRDVTHGVLLAIQKGTFGTYHFSVPSERTVADVVRGICKTMGYDFATSTRVVGERLGQDMRYWLDCSKAATELGWKATISFDEGVRETVEWIEENWSVIQNEPLTYQHKVRSQPVYSA